MNRNPHRNDSTDWDHLPHGLTFVDLLSWIIFCDVVAR